jgi:hypothetical protein
VGGDVRFAFRHFPLTEIHPHALAASPAAEAAALRDRFREMHELLFHRQKALEDADLRSTGASWGWTSGSSTPIGAARRSSIGSSETSGAGSNLARGVALRRCSSTASCIWGLRRGDAVGAGETVREEVHVDLDF